MEGGDENAKQGKQRRIWSSFEEEFLLNVLDGIVASGQRCDTGSFKSGTAVKIENALNLLCPNSNLKASPHIESKSKKLKKDYSIIYDMINKSRFAWNDVKTCVEVDSNEVWEAYEKQNKNAKGWRNKSYPMFERLTNIFGNDRANGSAAETPADMVEEQSNNEVQVEVDVENDTSPLSISREASRQSQVSQKKRKRNDEDRVMVAMNKLFEESGKQLQMVTDAILKGNEDRYYDISKEIEDIGLPILDQIKVVEYILKEPHRISVFKSLRGEARTMYVEQALLDARRGST